MDGINYLALGISGLNQLGTSTKADSKSEQDLTNGLTIKELKEIDSDQDGSITETEFKAKFGGKKYKTYWNAYKSFCKAKTTKTKDKYGKVTGYTSTQKTKDGKTIKSTYDKTGKLKSYSVVSKNAETGITTTIKYTVKNGKATKSQTTQTDADGKKVTVSGKCTTKTTADGTAVTTKKVGDKDLITTVSTKDSSGVKHCINFTYDKSGNPKSATVKIGNKEVTGTAKVEDDGTITISDKSGRPIAKINKNSKTGNTSVTEYNYNSKKARKTVYTVNSDGEATKIKTYDNKGNKVEYKNTETGVTRSYKYKNGKLSESFDYNKDGVLTSSQTYATDKASKYYANKKGSLWASRTFYDKDGNVTGYQTYEYQSNNNKKTEVTVTVKKYASKEQAETKGAKPSETITYTKDGSGHNLKKVVKKPGEDAETTTYTYGDKNNTKLSKTVTSKGNKTTTTNYDESGRVKSKSVSSYKNGKGTRTNYSYEYYENSNVVKSVTKKSGDKKVVKTYSQDGKLESKTVTKGDKTYTYKYKSDGSYTKEYEDSDGNPVIEYYDKDGNLIEVE